MDCIFDESVAFPFLTLRCHNWPQFCFLLFESCGGSLKGNSSTPLSLWKHQRRLFTSHELYGGMEGERGHNGPIFGQKGHISRRFKLVILFSGHFNVSYKCGGGPLQQNRHLHLLWRGHSKTPLLVDQSILHAQEEGFLKYRMLSVLTETGFCYICHAFIRDYTTQITEKLKFVIHFLY